MDDITLIKRDILEKRFRPIYVLYGDEHYNIDALTSLLEKNILTEDEKGFDQVVLYGNEVKVEDIVSHAKQFPMLSAYHVVIVKEAQHLKSNFQKFASYFENPQPSTVLVLSYKEKELDKRTKAFKALNSNAVVYQSKKLFDNQVEAWIAKTLQNDGYKIEPKATAMLYQFLGNDLSKIHNELDKLKILIQPTETITPHHIEENIGISKDFNIFEFEKAIAKKDQLKSYQIADHFAKNPKDFPLPMITSSIYNLFSRLLMCHGSPNKTKEHLAKLMGINPFFANDYITACSVYPMKKVSQCIAAVKDIDLKSKGIGANNMPYHDALKELLIRIFG